MKREFDWTQEFQETMNGHKVRILCHDAKRQYPIVGLILHDGEDKIASWTADGLYRDANNASGHDLRPLPPKKHVRWVNCYSYDTFYVYSSREEADRWSEPSRVACIRIEYTEGQFDD